jgi:hypothetical protein
MSYFTDWKAGDEILARFPGKASTVTGTTSSNRATRRIDRLSYSFEAP